MPVDTWTRSATRKATRRIIGEKGDAWEREGRYYVGLSEGTRRQILGSGSSYQEAFERVFVIPMRVKLEPTPADAPSDAPTLADARTSEDTLVHAHEKTPVD